MLFDTKFEEIEIVMKKSMPRRKDGTRSTDEPQGDVTAKDARRPKKKCMYCYHVYSYSHLIATHLNLNSSARCSEIPDEQREGITTDEQKWTSGTIQNCEKYVEAVTFKHLFAGHSTYSTYELLDMAEKKTRGYKGKLHVDLNIKTKLKLGQKLDPEEHKINYRSKAVRHQQKRVMDHIFGDRRFQLKDLKELNRWMDGDEERAFVNSHLIASSDGKNVQLSHSTIASLARSMIQLLHYVLWTLTSR